MRFQCSAPIYITGVHVKATAENPIIVTLPDNSKHVAMEWEPLDKKAQEAQVMIAKKNGLIKDKPRVLKSGDQEPHEEWDRRNQFKPFAADWTGKEIVEPREGATVINPRDMEAPLHQGLERSEKAAGRGLGVI